MDLKVQTILVSEEVPKSDATSTTVQSKVRNRSNSIPLEAAHFDDLPENGYVRASVVRMLFGISNATMYRWIHAMRIPAPKKIGHTSLFQVGQLRACLEHVQSSGPSVLEGRGK